MNNSCWVNCYCECQRRRDLAYKAMRVSDSEVVFKRNWKSKEKIYGTPFLWGLFILRTNRFAAFLLISYCTYITFSTSSHIQQQQLYFELSSTFSFNSLKLTFYLVHIIPDTFSRHIFVIRLIAHSRKYWR